MKRKRPALKIRRETLTTLDPVQELFRVIGGTLITGPSGCAPCPTQGPACDTLNCPP